MTSQLDFFGTWPEDGPAPDGVAGSLTDDIEKPRLMTLEAAVAPPPFAPALVATLIDPCPTEVEVLWWRKLELRPPP